jgi:hypothetical protein
LKTWAAPPAFIYSNQGPKDAHERIVFDTVIDLDAEETEPHPPHTPSIDAVLLNPIRQLESTMDNVDQSQVGEWSFDGAHWGDDEHFSEDVSSQQT